MSLFPKRTKYERLIAEGFELLEPLLYQKFVDIWDYELIGEPQQDLRAAANNLYYELYRLAEWLIYADKRLEECGLSCFSKEESDKIKNKFLIDCPLICSNPKSLELIRLFESELSLCSSTSYRWLGAGRCYQGDLIYHVLEAVVEGQKTVYDVPDDALLSWYTDRGIPTSEAQKLIDSRVIEENSAQCCPYDSINAPFVEIAQVIATAISLNYQTNNPDATITFTLNNQTQSFTQPSGTVIFSGLTPDTSYQLTVTVSNCAGTNQLTVPIQTPPYIVTIEIGQNLVGNIQFLNGLQLGTNVFPNYCTQVNIGFEGINQLNEITVFTRDGQNVISQVVWNQVVSGKNIGGTFTIPCIDKDYVIFIDGVRATSCEDIDVQLTGTTVTISV